MGMVDNRGEVLWRGNNILGLKSFMRLPTSGWATCRRAATFSPLTVHRT